MAEIEDAPLDGEESFVDKLSQLDRGLQVFLGGLAIGLTVLIVTIVQMCRAAFGNEGGYDEDIALAPAPAAAPKLPARPHATSQIRPISPNGKRASGSKPAKHSRDIESGEGDEARGSSRVKSSRAKPPPKATASGGRKAPLGEKAPLRKSLGSEKSSRKAAFQAVCSKASSDGASQLTSGDDDDQSDDRSDDHSDDHDSGNSDESDSDDAPLMTRLTLQVAPASHAHLFPDRMLKCVARAQAPYGETVETELDLADVSSFEELQAIVAHEWKEMVGGKMSSSMKMEYEDEDGDFVKASRSTPIDELTSSPAIRLLRKGSGKRR